MILKAIELQQKKKKKNYWLNKKSFANANQACTLSAGSLNSIQILLFIFMLNFILEGVYTHIGQIQRTYLTLYCQILKRESH